MSRTRRVPIGLDVTVDRTPDAWAAPNAPAIAYLARHHFVVVTRVTDRHVHVTDPGSGRRRLALAALLAAGLQVLAPGRAAGHEDHRGLRDPGRAHRDAGPVRARIRRAGTAVWRSHRGARAGLAGPAGQRRPQTLISHRGDAVRDADQIIVLDRGRIVRHGTHPELLAADGVHRDLFAAADQAPAFAGNAEGR